MKLLSFATAVCRHFSSQAPKFNKKKWGKSNSSKNKMKQSGNDLKTPKKPKIKLTDEQKEVLDAISSGKSVFITGSAGTGKTLFLQRAIRELKKIYGRKMIYVTASSGTSACVLPGTTLHCFAGIGIGDGDPESLVERVLLDRRACSRWRRPKVLVIDEISMVDAELFSSLEYIARRIRDNGDKIWGGLQLIVSGDFFQLPPVAKRGKKVEYAFESKCWHASFDIEIEFDTVFRQSDALLIQLLQKIRKGEIDLDDLKLLEGCCSGIEPDPSAVRLFPRIADVNKVNKEKMESLNEEIHVYSAKDSGEEPWLRQLKSGIAPDELELCVGARVMLTKNINPLRKLVNGSTGTVVEFCKVSEEQYEFSCSHGSVLPVVKFDSGLELVVEPEIWVVMDGDKVVAVRRQIPLILAWALSIHKCQGMTLDKLHTDLSRVFDYGMVYVALSRVKSLAGLYLSGLDPSKIKAHPKVLDFYKKFESDQDDKKRILIAKKSEIDGGNKALEFHNELKSEQVDKKKVFIAKKSETDGDNKASEFNNSLKISRKTTRSF